MPLWEIVQSSELIRQTSPEFHLLTRLYAGAPGCASHFQKATPLPVILHGSFICLGHHQNMLISQSYIFNTIGLGGIANTAGVGLLAADKRGYKNVSQAGFWRRAWLWRRMGKCPGAKQCWGEGQRAQGRMLMFSVILPGPAALAISHYTSCTVRCLVGGRKKAVVLEMGQQKLRNRRAGEREGSPPLLS